MHSFNILKHIFKNTSTFINARAILKIKIQKNK